MPKICEFETCRKQASYGEYYGKPIRCGEHKECYKLVCTLCRNGDCNKQPTYNIEGETKGLYCMEHKKEDMVNIKCKTCVYPDCKKQPCYNAKGETKGIYCTQHKKEGMMNVKDPTCIHEGCQKIPIYNNQDQSKGIYCFEHKLDDMINVKDPKCKHTGCQKIPNYNKEGEKKGLFCADHKIEGMIDVKNKKCVHPDCKKLANYNFEGKDILYCTEHKKEGMVNIKSKKCLFPNCKTQPCYNIEGETRGIYCVKHKKNDMVNVLCQTCIYPNCNIIPSYNFQEEIKALYCTTHKKEGMIDIKTPKCKANFCMGTRVNIKYKGYCASCFVHLFPNDPLSFQTRCKTKELAVRDYINTQFEGFQHDSPLYTGNCDCTHRRRIDHRKMIGNTLLCIETDENQHKLYDKKDEEIRYDDVMMIHGGKFIFIRFNPDKYKKKTGESVNPMLYTRLPVLKKEIEKQIARIEKGDNTELLEIVKLYYDE
jgi:hypothetical protein